MFILLNKEVGCRITKFSCPIFYAIDIKTVSWGKFALKFKIDDCPVYRVHSNAGLAKEVSGRHGDSGC